jgi:hypothetical protein
MSRVLNATAGGCVVEEKVVLALEADADGEQVDRVVRGGKRARRLDKFGVANWKGSRHVGTRYGSLYFTTCSKKLSAARGIFNEMLDFARGVRS